MKIWPKHLSGAFVIVKIATYVAVCAFKASPLLYLPSCNAWELAVGQAAANGADKLNKYK